MSPTMTILLLWLAFAASHMLLSSLWLRPRMVGALGEKGFLGVYSLISLVTFFPLVYVYFGNKHAGSMIWSIAITPPMEIAINVVMGVAIIILVAGVLTPSPASMSVSPDASVEVKGVHYITRHGVFMGTGLFGLIHLIPNGFASDIAFFAGFPIFAVVGCIHQDRRKLVTDSARYTEFHAATPLIPFTGNQTLRGLRELSFVAYAVGISMTIALRYFHAQWFG
jgi:uncharacterized membrane protein